MVLSFGRALTCLTARAVQDAFDFEASTTREPYMARGFKEVSKATMYKRVILTCRRAALRMREYTPYRREARMSEVLQTVLRWRRQRRSRAVGKRSPYTLGFLSQGLIVSKQS